MSTTISNIKRLLKQAHPEIAIQKDQLNQSKHLLCCNNYTVDLETGEYRKHSPKDYFTYCTHIDIVKPEILPDGYISFPEVFDRFISNLVYKYNSRITEKRKYMMLKLIGKYLHGRPGKRSFLHIFGAPGTGKSKLADLLYLILGDYAVPLSFKTLAPQKSQGGSGPSPDIVEPMGKRVAIIDEPSTKKHLSTSMMKALTGGTRMKGRLLYSNDLKNESSTYTPIFLSNGILVFDEPDTALNERITMIQTTRIVMNRDEKIIEKLQKEAGCILGILVLLGIPDESTIPENKLNPEIAELDLGVFHEDKRDFVRKNINLVEQFFIDMVVPENDAVTTTEDLYEAFRSYCMNKWEESSLPTRKMFCILIQEKYSLEKCRVNNLHAFRSITIRRGIAMIIRSLEELYELSLYTVPDTTLPLVEGGSMQKIDKIR